MDKFGIRPLCPTTRGLIELSGKDAHGNRDGDVLDVEKRKLAFPIETSRRNPRVRQENWSFTADSDAWRIRSCFELFFARSVRTTGWSMLRSLSAGRNMCCTTWPATRIESRSPITD